MKKSKRIIAMISAMTMLWTFNTTASLSAKAAEENFSTSQTEVINAFDYVPGSYEEAMEFYNKYGQTYCETGYICTVQQKDAYERDSYKTEQSGTAECNVLFSYEYISGSEYTGGYSYEVTLYQAKTSGSMNISWLNMNTQTGKIIYQTDFSFDIAENFSVTQTDLYSWVPDSMQEYEAFYKKYGKASVYNGYVVYCNDIMSSAGFSLIADHTGSGRLETVLDTYVSEATDIEIVGGASHRVIVYKPVKAGDVTMAWTHGRLWELDAEYTQITTQHYIVSDDLSINSEYNNGDCNFDGKAFITADLVAIKKYLTGASRDYDVFSPQNADINNDEKINVFDFIIMKRDFRYQTGLPDIENHLDYTIIEDECIRTYLSEMTFSAFVAESADELCNIIEENENIIYESIDESIFENKAAVVVYSCTGAGNRVITVDDVFTENYSNLIIETTTMHPDHATPDMAYNRIILIVDKDAVADVTSTVIRNTNISEK